jgi:hypothetical protein
MASQEQLADITVEDLKDVGLKPGHIATLWKLCCDLNIPNPELSSRPASSLGSARGSSELALSMKASSSEIPSLPNCPRVYKLPVTKTGEDSVRKIRAVTVGPRTWRKTNPKRAFW